MRIAADKQFPFALKAPNAETQLAMKEVESNQTKRFDSMESLLKDFINLKETSAQP